MAIFVKINAHRFWLLGHKKILPKQDFIKLHRFGGFAITNHCFINDDFFDIAHAG